MSANHKRVLIVGCQRSGTTLLEAIFNAHPKVRVIGEEKGKAYDYFFHPSKLAELNDEWVCLRIPAATQRVKHAVDHFPGAAVLFVLRDPRDVVLSMRKLDVGNESWLAHFGQNQIRRVIPRLPDRQSWDQRLRQLCDRVDDPNDVRFGAFLWAAKNGFIPIYSRSPLPTKLVRYEVLTKQPEPYLRQICKQLGLEWSDRLLEHQNYSSGEFAGTNKGEAIHQDSIQRYKTELTMEERRNLHSVIQSDMEMLGYVELFDRE